MGAILALLTGFLTFAVGSTFPGNIFKSTIPVQKTFNARCFLIEPNEKLIITENDLTDRGSCKNLIGSYTRVRRNVSIIPGKIHDESDGVRGTCIQSGTLRLVGSKDDNQLWWLDNNYKFQDLRDFVEVLKDKKDKSNYFLSVEDNGDYVFDIYAKDGILNNLPDHVVNCLETGGLVPVVEGESGILPPQIVPIKDIATSSYKNNYENIFLKANTSFPPYKNFLIKIDKQDLPQDALEKGQIGIYTTPQVKNSTHAYDVFYHLGSFYLRDKSDQSSYVYGTSVDGPPQTVDNNPSLQLGRLWFRVVDSWTAFTPNCKPAIYLYPQKPQEVQVKLDIAGKITVSDPIYNPETGWNVKAYPDGAIQLLDSGKDTSDGVRQHSSEVEESKYPYLYYEAMLENGYKPKEGWIVSRDKINDQLKAILNTVGLSERERDDFLEYWLPRLTMKPYYFAGLVPAEDIDKQEVLKISPSPSNIIRVRLIFEGLDYPIFTVTPKLSTIKREGFTVVDWGGTLVGQSCEGKKIQ